MSSLADRLKKIDVSKLKNKKGKTLAEVLQFQADYLRSLIEKHLQDYLDNNNLPNHYYMGTGKRTGSLAQSVRVEDVAQVRVNGTKMEVYVYFDEKAHHGSGYGAWKKSDGDDVNVAELINYGYEVKEDVWFKNIENFGYREPALFVEDAIDEFNVTNTMGLKINKKTDIILK